MLFMLEHIINNASTYGFNYHILRRDSYFSRISQISLLPMSEIELSDQILYITDDFYRPRQESKHTPVRNAEELKRNHILFVTDNINEVPDYAFGYVEAELSLVLMDLQNSLYELMRWDYRLADEAANALGMQQMLDLSALLIGCPMLVYDPRLKVLAEYGISESELASRRELVSGGYISEFMLNRLCASGLYPPSKDADSITVLPPGVLSDGAAVTVAIDLGEELKFCLFVLCEEHEVGIGRLALIENLADKIKSCIENTQSSLIADRLQYELILSDIISLDDIDEDALAARASIEHIPIHAAFRLFVLSPDKARDFPRQYIVNVITSNISGSYVFQYNNNIICLTDMPEGDGSRNSRLDYCLSVLASLSGDHMFGCGLSDPFSHLKDVKIGYQQALAAIELSERIRKSSFLQEFSLQHKVLNTAVCCYREYMDYDILLHYTGSTDPTRLIAPPLRDIIEYARKRNPSRLQVLYAYLQNDCSIQKTAEELHMHKNNVGYHIQKIEQCYDLDLQKTVVKYQIVRSIMAATLFM